MWGDYHDTAFIEPYLHVGDGTLFGYIYALGFDGCPSGHSFYYDVPRDAEASSTFRL